MAKHEQPAGRRSADRRRNNDPTPRTRREPLRDNYYYEQPGGGGEFQDISSYSSQVRREMDRRQMRSPKKSAKPPRRRMGFGKKLLLICLALVVLAAGLGWYMLGGLTAHRLTGELGVNRAVRETGIKNIALFGVDSRDGGSEGRSDAVMILSLNSREHKLKMVSLMRDSYVNIEGYGYEKLTHAYAYGGPELAVRTINENFSMDIEDYATVNFYEMAEIVEAFGGVELEVTGDEMREVNRILWDLDKEAQQEGRASGITAADYFTALDGTHNAVDGEYAGGRVLLTGSQAVAYSRIRYLDGDEYRAGRQQRVLMGLKDRMKARGPLAWPGIAHGVAPNVETSLGAADLAGLVPFALGGMEMESITLPTEEDGAYGDDLEDDGWVYMFDEELARERLHRFLFG